jgi:uncharacterized membrane protein
MILAIILILGLILRLISLNHSFWLDEAVQVWTTHFSLNDLLISYMPGDFNPPLYHIITHFWIKLGSGEEVVRLLPVFLGIISIFLVYKITNIIDSKNKKFVYFSALGLATSPLHIYYSQENRMYILACATFLLAVFSHLYFWQKPSLKKACLYSLGVVLMSFSHFLTYFTLPVFFFFDFLNSKKVKTNHGFFWTMPILVLALSLAIYSPLFIKQLQTGMEWTKQFPVWKETVGSFTLKAAVLLPIKFVIGRISVDNKLIYGGISIVLLFLYWGIVSLAVFRNVTIKNKKGRKTYKFKNNQIGLVSLLLIIPPLAGFLVSFFVPIFSYFRFLFVLPLFYTLLSWQISKTNIFFKPLAIAIVAINLACSGIYLADSNFHREDWRGMTTWLTQRNIQYQAPVIISGQIAKPFDHYNKEKLPTVYINNSSDIKKINLNLKETVYLVSYGLPIFDPEDKIRTVLREKSYQMTRGESFRKVGIEEWRVF